MKESRVKIGSVNGGMAAGAVPSRLEAQPAMRNIDGCRIYVTLQAQESFLSPRQQHAVDAAVGGMACRAALHFYRGVLKHEGAPLFDVALRAGFPSALP